MGIKLELLKRSKVPSTMDPAMLPLVARLIRAYINDIESLCTSCERKVYIRPWKKEREIILCIDCFADICKYLAKQKIIKLRLIIPDSAREQNVNL